MSIYLKVAIFTLASASALAAVAYHYSKPKHIPRHSVAGFDISDSVPRNCGCLVNLVKKKFNDPAMVNGAVTVIASGNDTSADEPTLVSALNVPSTRRVVEGSKATQRKQETLLADLVKKCESLPVTKRSPIALLVQRGLERLHHAGCGPQLHGCELMLQTDAEETAEATIKKLLDSSGPIKGSKPLFDNAGINVTFVNVSETIGAKDDAAGRRQRLTANHNPEKVRRLQNVWRAFFTEPARVHFEPFCPAK